MALKTSQIKTYPAVSKRKKKIPPIKELGASCPSLQRNA